MFNKKLCRLKLKCEILMTIMYLNKRSPVIGNMQVNCKCKRKLYSIHCTPIKYY